MTNMLNHTHTDDRGELLSDYLDNALDVAARQRADRTLKECAACAEELADLRSLQTMLRALPAPIPRRSFTLDPATVRPRRLLFPIFRFASLAAAVMLFVVLGIDMLPSTNNVGVPTSAMMESRAAKDAEPAAGAAPAPEYSVAQATPEPIMGAFSVSEPTMAAETGADAAAATEATAAAAAASDAATTEAPAPAAAAAAPTTVAEADQPLMPEEQAASTLAQPSAVAGGELADAPEALRSSDNAAGETETLDAPAAEVVAAPFDLWLTLAYVLAVFAVGLGGAWWWTARRGI